MGTGGKRLAARLELIDGSGAHPFEAISDSVFVGKVLNERDKSNFKKRIARPLIPAPLQAVGLQAKCYFIIVGSSLSKLRLRFCTCFVCAGLSLQIRIKVEFSAWPYFLRYWLFFM